MAEKRAIKAIDIKRGVTVAQPTGGSTVVEAGSVLLVPGDIGVDDAKYLCAMGKAEPCVPQLKETRAKEKAAAAKAAEKDESK